MKNIHVIVYINHMKLLKVSLGSWIHKEYLSFVEASQMRLEIFDTKSFFSSNFEMKDMGEVDVILGIKIIRDSNRIMLSQEHYIEIMLKRFGHFDCTPVFTPYDGSIHLRKNKEQSVSQSEYAQIISSL